MFLWDSRHISSPEKQMGEVLELCQLGWRSACRSQQHRHQLENSEGAAKPGGLANNLKHTTRRGGARHHASERSPSAGEGARTPTVKFYGREPAGCRK
ncbi:hypothetical protein AAFF_G00217240 [Aldrovandia affinis]|uniref:Uncharacterized protein n=1 Tax=Aldrovandia affinis TaxID=143900 RepID=A0AAD7WUP1_9TELE|nr:hypothetical protein AAFF_G00217240 [Aldrovandia affinis]